MYETHDDGVIRKYYAFAGATFAMRACTGGTCSAPTYFLTDHLGSVDVVLSTTGTVLSQQRYLPFGGARTLSGTNVPNPNVPGTDFGYTSQRALPETGLIDFKARMYDPWLGRFIQPDTVIPGAANPQAWNRYSYVLNRPIISNDPTGHILNIIGGAVAGAILGGVIYAANAAYHGNDIKGTDLLLAVGVGAAAGALIGSGAGAVAGLGLIEYSAGMGMATSAVGYTLAAGKNYKSSEMLLSAGVGLAAGAALGGVSSAFAKPLPMNYGGCLNEGSRWATHMAIDFGINAGAGAAQQIGTNIINKKQPLSDVGAAFTLGGATPAGVDILLSPISPGLSTGVGGFLRSSAVQTFNNGMLEDTRENDHQTSYAIRKSLSLID